ncbi:replication initiator protein A [uncultured Pseudomonas sp.]|uniref:replication initiator protein A n=1 Tax=uncultured Pseudomonas sp. TaxID=114707 RepID=UPI0025FC7903|nr:replication initiator protein A [uncultured Pseudomonas sp.]
MYEASQSKIEGRPSSIFEKLNKRSEEAAERNKRKSEFLTESVCLEDASLKNLDQIRFFPRKASAMPTTWTRTSLFSSLKKGQRRLLVDELVESRNDCCVRVSGEQLDMCDNDVFLHIIQLAQGSGSGALIYFERSTFLRAIGRGNDLSSESYRRLEGSMKRLASTTIFIEGVGGGESFHLINKLTWGCGGRYCIAMDPVIVSIFASQFLTYIDMDVRLRLRSPLAKYLQNYVCGHNVGRHAIPCESLRRWSGSTGRLRDFTNRALPAALGELEAQGLIRNWEIGLEMVRWSRLPHRYSKKA